MFQAKLFFHAYKVILQLWGLGIKLHVKNQNLKPAWECKNFHGIRAEIKGKNKFHFEISDLVKKGEQVFIAVNSFLD